MSPNKRDGGKRLSGNPQHREQQLESQNPAKTGPGDEDGDGAPFRRREL